MFPPEWPGGGGVPPPPSAPLALCMFSEGGDHKTKTNNVTSINLFTSGFQTCNTT